MQTGLRYGRTSRRTLLQATLGAAPLIFGHRFFNSLPSIAQEAVGDVQMLGGNPARTGEMRGPGPTGDPRVLWGV